MYPLVFCVKYFLIQQNLYSGSNGCFGGYGVIMWVASFLQLYPIVYQDSRAPFDRNELGQLFLDFLNFFGDCFDYEKSGLQPSLDGQKPVLIQKGTHLNPKHPYLLVLLDPHQAGNDLGGNVFNVRKIQHALSRAHYVLTNIPHEIGEKRGYLSFIFKDYVKKVKPMKRKQCPSPCHPKKKKRT